VLAPLLPWAARSLAYGLGLPHAGGGPTDYRTQYSKHRGGETLREDVGELRCRRDMEDADLIDENFLSDKMKINLHMLRTLMLNGVGGEVHDADVVTVDESATRWRCLELMQELVQSGGLSHTIGDGTVLGFGAGASPGCPRGTRHSPTWSDECPGSQPSRRRCRRPGWSWMSGATASRSQASHEDSARCASWPSSGAPEGRACAGRSAARHKRCRVV
jgi:hypothetical protein